MLVRDGRLADYKQKMSPLVINGCPIKVGEIIPQKPK